MLNEILEIPYRAELALKEAQSIRLPEDVPYLGMGSSYYAPLALYFQGFKIQPALASDYHYYLSESMSNESGVLISQSGKSTEVLWCARYFKKITGISNEMFSPLMQSPLLIEKISMLAGDEKYSSTKTYINTLIILYSGLQKDPASAIEQLKQNISKDRDWGEKIAKELAALFYTYPEKGICIVGSGSEYATARQGALILSETIKKTIVAYSLAEYDHGPKESAPNSVVIFVLTKDESYERAMILIERVKRAGATVYIIIEDDRSFSPILNIMPLNFLTYFLAARMGIELGFEVGGKVTEV